MKSPEYIKSVQFSNFVQFSDLTIDFAKNINVISGENGVGKTNIMKGLYSVGKVVNDLLGKQVVSISSDKPGELIAEKLVGVYRPDKLGRLVKRKVGRGSASCAITFNDQQTIEMSFSNLASKNVDVSGMKECKSLPNFIYIPPKEIISAVENFASLYEDYHIAFEETYYDLNKLLLRPLKKGPLSAKQKQLVQSIEQIIAGKVSLKDNKFYLTAPDMGGSFEMGLLAEGYRKLATILQLILNGTLSEHTILFWDEPEANMNPKMIPPLKDLFIALAKMGVQLFITTHSYFLQKELSLFAEYENKEQMDIQFITLFKTDVDIEYESKRTMLELENNPIQQEFENLYNREQDLFYHD